MAKLCKILALFLVFFFSFLSQAQENTLVPVGSKLIAPHRYESSRPYKDTVREVNQRLASSKKLLLFGDEINLPHMRLTRFYNPDPNALLSALNIYTNLLSTATEIFFVQRLPASKP